MAEYLLVQAQPALCYSCHNGSKASTSPYNGVQYGTSGTTVVGALRGGGFNTARIGSGAATKDMGALDPTSGRIATLNQYIPPVASQSVTSRHEINGTAGTAWGNGPINGNTANGDLPTGKTMTLECGSCHDPHGNGNYRILRAMPVDSQWVVTKASLKGVSPVVKEVLSAATNVKIPDVPADVDGSPSNHIYTTTNYWLTGDTKSPVNATVLTGDPKVTDLSTDGYIQNIAAWCTTCHTRYLAASGSYKTENKGYDRAAGTNITTGTTDSTFMYRHRSDANYKQGAANCITCHVSHGSNAQMSQASAVTDPGASGGASPTTDSRLLRVDNRGTCLMCHNV